MEVAYVVKKLKAKKELADIDETFLTKLVQSLTPAMMDEIEVFLRRFYGEKYEPIFHTVVFLLYLPVPMLEELISKLLLF